MLLWVVWSCPRMHKYVRGQLEVVSSLIPTMWVQGLKAAYQIWAASTVICSTIPTDHYDFTHKFVVVTLEMACAQGAKCHSKQYH